MKKEIFFIVMLFIWMTATTQSINEFVMSNRVIQNQNIGTDSDFENLASSNTWLTTVSAGKQPGYALLSNYLGNLSDRVVVVIRHKQKITPAIEAVPAKPAVLATATSPAIPASSAVVAVPAKTEERFEKIQILTLTKNASGNLDSYILEKKRILFVILGGEETIQQSSFKVIETKSFFKNSFEETLSLVEALGFGTMSGTTKTTGASFPIRIVELDPGMIKTPCKVEVDYPGRGQDIEINIHEKSSFSFQVGVGGKQINKNTVKLDNQQLIVELDSTQKEEWKSDLSLFLTWHPGRDIDRFKPVWKQDLKSRTDIKAGQRWQYYTIRRMGIYGGVELSTDPINNLYAGVNYAITNKFYLNFGANWANQITPSVTNIGEIDRVKDALKYADRKYKPSLYFGVSFAPSTISEFLGLDGSAE
ncbi:MAG: hypothetical protein ACJA08_001007 [Cyclobacteriaceae bacterium]|jgi:hypothetical protein